MDGRRMILVTGASGFLGNHVARLLLERGETVSTAWAWVTGGSRSGGIKPRPAALGYLLASG